MYSSPRPDQLYHYQLYGWHLQCERPLPMMMPFSAGMAADDTMAIELRFGPIARPDEAPIFEEDFIALYEGDIALLTYPNMRVMISGGRHILVDADGPLSDTYLHTYLCGAVMTVASHQRRVPPLHANVLDIGGKGFAVAGHSGAGKSTISRALLLRGHRMVCDDHARIDPATRLVQAGSASMKVWQDTAAYLGDNVDDTLRVAASIKKFHLRLDKNFLPLPIALDQIIVLKPEPGLSHPALTPLQPNEAAMVLHHMVQRWRVAHALDKGESIFRWALALSRSVPVSVLQRCDDFGQLNRLCEMIEELAARGAPR